MEKEADIEILKNNLLKQAEKLDQEIHEFHSWKLRHPIQYHKWLQTPEGKKYKLHKMSNQYMMGL